MQSSKDEHFEGSPVSSDFHPAMPRNDDDYRLLSNAFIVLIEKELIKQSTFRKFGAAAHVETNQMTQISITKNESTVSHLDSYTLPEFMSRERKNEMGHK